MSNSTTPAAADLLPESATWDDYVAAHGGPDVPGWWVTLCWHADSEYPRPEAVGPYRSYELAVSAMEDSLLIDSFCEDTKRAECLDDVFVSTTPASIAVTCAAFGSRVTLIDPSDPNHFGLTDQTAAAEPSAGISVWYAGMQAAALNATPPPQVEPIVRTGPGGPSWM